MEIYEKLKLDLISLYCNNILLNMTFFEYIFISCNKTNENNLQIESMEYKHKLINYKYSIHFSLKYKSNITVYIKCLYESQWSFLFTAIKQTFWGHLFCELRLGYRQNQ